MAVTALIRDPSKIYGQFLEEVGEYPKTILNRQFRELLQYREFIVYGDGKEYVAFPECELVGGKIVGQYSVGVAHAQSDRVLMFVYDPATDDVQTRVFTSNATPNVFDTTLVDALMVEGESFTLNPFTLRKINGVVRVLVVPILLHQGVTYANWSRAKKRGNIFYRTAYSTAGTPNITAALFRSTDNQQTWQFVATIFAREGIDISETDFCWRPDGTMLAVGRVSTRTEGSRVGRLEWGTAPESGEVWTSGGEWAPSLINGVQPNLGVRPNGDVVLFTSDRSGSSGLVAGVGLYGVDVTGIASWVLKAGTSPAEANWSLRQALAFLFSTDGGQPYHVTLPDGKVFVAFYARRSVGRKAQGFAMIFDWAQLS